MKRVMIFLLLFVLSIAALSGCGSTIQDNSGSIDAGEEDNISEFGGVSYSQEGIVGLWRCLLKEPDDSPEIIGYLLFGENGSLAFDYGDGYGPAGMGMVKYRGTWYIDPDMGPSNLPDALVVDLSRDSAIFAYDEENFPSEISGVYTFTIENNHLYLTFVSGDNLYRDEGELFWNYDFEWDDSPKKENFNVWRFSDSELIEYMKDLLYAKYSIVDADVFYPGELDKYGENTMWLGFVYDDGNGYKYAWLDAMTGEVEIADEVYDYIGEG